MIAPVGAVLVRWDAVPDDMSVHVPTLEDALLGLLDGPASETSGTVDQPSGIAASTNGAVAATNGAASATVAGAVK
jgi:hypothetical protein